MNAKKHIFYRGSLSFCNYSCSYCPFSKGKGSERQLQQDREELTRFVDQLKVSEFRGAVQIVPYGEALIHDYYWEALACMSRIPGVEAVGAQTNLSFPVERMLSIYREAGGKVEKLRLWGTFHPEMVSIEQFLMTCAALGQEGVSFCVGSVGVPGNISLLQELRSKLDSSVYLWINKMDGLGRNYTEKEVEELCEIDEYFELELQHHKADAKKCNTAIFVDSRGECHPCNMCRNSVGNIYDTSLKRLFRECGKRKACKKKECECYLAYGNRRDLEELVFFQPYPAFRIPVYKKAIFFDVDGTLVAEEEKELSEKKAAWIRKLAMHSDIYLATSLPYEDAMRKMKPVASLVSGGVFAGGGRVRIQMKESEMVFWDRVASIHEEVMPFVERLRSTYVFRIHTYKRGQKLYKIVLNFWVDELPKQMLKDIGKLRKVCHVMIEDNKVELTAKGASKLAGIQRICEKLTMSLDDIAVFGNSEADLEMIREVPFSVAAAGSCKAVKEVAKIVLE
nr:STM4011 family radical SAM protein [Eubacterium sp.]